MGIEPDTKDWTWVLDRPCPECAFVATAIRPGEVDRVLGECAVAWQGVLVREDVARRPSSSTWSPLEYACHVRDVCRVMQERFTLMLDRDAPTFANWDQDATAVARRYAEQDPAQVRQEVAEAFDDVRQLLREVPPTSWDRPGLRDNGSAFTVLSLARYFLHDVVHHLHDVAA